MHCFLCSVRSGHLVLKEHENATWLNREELGSVDWLPADVEVVKKLVGRNNVEIKVERQAVMF
ncbi:NUDIX hydrolase [Phocaeicola coprocola]